MGSLPVIVGLDYSDGAVQVCVMNLQGEVVGNRACANDWQAIVKFAQSRGRWCGRRLRVVRGRRIWRTSW